MARKDGGCDLTAREVDGFFSDPAWAAAEAEAQTAAEQLRRVTDPVRRQRAFGLRAQNQSDDSGSGANGGDLGYFSRDMMVPEFADPLFDATVEATEEAVLNALWAAPDVVGRDGRLARGLPHDEVLALLRAAGRLDA